MGRLFGSKAGSDDEEMETVIVAGLGNPGSKYEGTRHNVGFEAVDRLAEKLAADVRKKKFNALLGQALYKDKKVLLLKPQSYMNCSGQVLATAGGFYRLKGPQMMVITDDMALEPGIIRLKPKGSAGGHNGLADIIQKVGGDFNRCRVGIGKSPYPNTKDYVLGRIGSDERALIDPALDRAVEAVLEWIEFGIDSAMTKYNVKNVNNENEDN